MWEKGIYAIYEQRMSRWACASVQPGLDILCSSTCTTVSIDSVSGQRRSQSICPFVQADRGLHCPPFDIRALSIHCASYKVLSVAQKVYSYILNQLWCFIIYITSSYTCILMYMYLFIIKERKHQWPLSALFVFCASFNIIIKPKNSLETEPLS